MLGAMMLAVLWAAALPAPAACDFADQAGSRPQQQGRELQPGNLTGEGDSGDFNEEGWQGHVTMDNFSATYPHEVSAIKMYDPTCEWSPQSVKKRTFILNNKEALRKKGIQTNDWFSWVAVLTFVTCCGTLLLSYLALPENPMGDMGSWHLFGKDSESQKRRAVLYERMRRLSISREKFIEALPNYKSGLEFLSEDQQHDLFDFIAADQGYVCGPGRSDGGSSSSQEAAARSGGLLGSSERPRELELGAASAGTRPARRRKHHLTFENFSKVRMVPPWCGWAREWINARNERWSKQQEIGHDAVDPEHPDLQVRPMKVLLGSFRAFSDNGERAWFALHVAAGNWERIATGDVPEPRSRQSAFSVCAGAGAADSSEDSGSDSDPDRGRYTSKLSAGKFSLSQLSRAGTSEWTEPRRGTSDWSFSATGACALDYGRLDANWGFETDPAKAGSRPPTLQDFILQRFNPDLPRHSRMRVVELLPPCAALPDYAGSDRRKYDKREWDWKKAYGYITDALGRSSKVAGLNHVIMPFTVQTGFLLFFAQAFTGCWVEVSKWLYLASWGHDVVVFDDVQLGEEGFPIVLPAPFSWWSYFFGSSRFWLTFKPELYLYLFYSHGRLWVLTIRLLALSGINLLTLRSSYGRDLKTIFQNHFSVMFSMLPALVSLLLFVFMLPFAPVFLLFLLVWTGCVRLLELLLHKFGSDSIPQLLRLPAMTSAPMLALALMFPLCRILTDRTLKNTYLCNWSKMTILSIPESISDTGNVQDDFTGFLAGGALMLLVLTIMVPLAWCALCSDYVEWLLVRLTYRWWLNQSEPLLSMLHRGSKTTTAQIIAHSFVKHTTRPSLPRCIPAFIRVPIENFLVKFDAAARPPKGRYELDDEDDVDEDDDDDEGSSTSIPCQACPRWA